MPSWAAVVIRRRWWIIIGATLFVVVAGALGAGVADHLRSGGYVDQDSSSARADRELARRFGAGSPNLVLLADAGGSIDSAAARDAGIALTERLRAEPHVEYVRSYWDPAGDSDLLRNEQGDKALLLARVAGDENEAKQRVAQMRSRLTTDTGPLTVTVGGRAQIDNEVDDQSKEDLLLAEIIIAPITLLILLWVFRSVIAALLPLVVAGFSVVGTQVVLLGMTYFTDVSIFALNVATGLGLGLAIDYSLLMVSRFREALAQDGEVRRALAVTMATAGRTIIFSSITVVCSLAGLMAFNNFFLRSLGYAGIAVTALCGLASLIALPAVLAALGHRVNKWRVPALRRRANAAGQEGRFWQAWVARVMRRPGWYAAGALALTLLLAAPVLSIQFSLADDRALPRSAPASQVSQAIRDEFPAQQVNSLTVVAHGVEGESPELVTRYASDLSALPGVIRVDGLTGSYADGEQVGPAGAESAQFRAQTGDGSYLTALVEPDPLSDASRDLVADARGLDAPFPVDVSGTGAMFADTLAGQRNGLPWALGVMVIATLIMLAWMTGSFVVPVKAILLNILSLAAAFGIIVWVFQEGHLRWLVGDFQVTGFVVSNMPLLLLCVAFGLSMDYEVFLLSRIKEEYDATGDNRRAVAVGIARTGRIVTAAALLMTVVFLSFVTSGVVYLKLIGLGTAMAILIDAVLIRAVLLPALMVLMGRVNWWAPRAFQRWAGTFRLREATSAEVRPEVREPAVSATEGPAR